MAKGISRRRAPARGAASTATPKTPQEVIRFATANGVEMVDLKFVDLIGTWQHFTIPIGEMDEKLFRLGSGFDGSSIRGFQQIHESDMLLVPDATTAKMDPFCEAPTLSMIGDVLDPHAKGIDKPGPYNRDPRYIAKKAEQFLAKSGLGDVSYWGPELEFFIFDTVRMAQNQNSGYYYIDSDEGNWTSGNEVQLDGQLNLAYKIRNKEGYYPVPPTDTQQDIRTEAVRRMQAWGMVIEKHHHEVATAGQGEIDMRYDSLTKMADQVMSYKYILKNVARAHGKVATFMPKPLFGDNGTGMHTHQSVWRGGKNLFSDPKGWAGISQFGLNYIGGLLKHAPALLGFAAPTTNSYRRLVPGFEAPVNLAMSMRNRSACARIPMYYPNPEAKRVEFRCPDPSCNPYLAFASMLMAGIDGVVNKIDPGEPLDKDIYALPPEEAAKVRKTPGSLQESLDALEADHDFMLRGGVFTEDVIEAWLSYKRERELDPMRLRPHPYEFYLYLDA
ncbi:MAG: type I glutamate--ammonia ligase [Dehalococcoidia bacterium]|nr:type I glutamate--ammonia ligase [Dehalococcoidia bacterium]